MGRFLRGLVVISLVLSLGLCQEDADATTGDVTGFDPRQEFDDQEAFVGAVEDGGQGDDNDVDDDEEEFSGLQDLVIEADGVNVIKVDEDTYKYLNGYSCPPGTYKLGQSKWGLSKAAKGKGCVCKICPVGHKCKNDKKKKCGCGRYQPKKGQPFCKNSGCGYFVPKKGLWYKIPCKAGTYAKNRINCGCKRASKGYKVAINSKKCGQMKCGKNSYQGCMGQHVCIPCNKQYEFANKYGATKCNKKYPTYY